MPNASKVVGVKPGRRRAMDYFCGLDIATETTALCVVDTEGTVLC